MKQYIAVEPLVPFGGQGGEEVLRYFGAQTPSVFNIFLFAFFSLSNLYVYN